MTTVHGLRMRVSTKTTAGVLHLRYRYAAYGMGFDFACLSEVGEPFKKEAVRCADHIAEQMGLAIRATDIDVKPWVVDALISKEEAKARDEQAERDLDAYRAVVLVDNAINNLYRSRIQEMFDENQTDNP